MNTNPYAPPSADEEPFAEEDGAALELATRSQRLGGAILDGILYLPLVLVAGRICAALQISPKDRAWYSLVNWACWLPLALFQWSQVVRTGQTLGKRWVHTKIVKLDGSPVDLLSGVVLRSWVMLALSMLTWTGVSVLVNVMMLVFAADPLVIFGEGRRCLHDLIAGTKVVALRRGTGLLG